ncbi:MAG: MASE3 domain-containing protein [Deltaproteobacteria bacterium]
MNRQISAILSPKAHLPVVIFGGLLLIGLYLTSLYNYLLFHSLAEIFSIVVAFALFVIAWNSRNYLQNPYLLFIGIAYLFIGGLDLLHTLSYKGLQIFTDYEYYANQLWIAARFLESLTLLVAFYYLATEKPVRPYRVFFGYLAFSGLLVASIFTCKIFPVCFIEGVGLTPFKKISEYIISGILLASIGLLVRNRDRFDRDVYFMLLGSMACTIISELAFTFYISNYGFSNLVGHYFKIFSFYLIYRAIIVTGFNKPFTLTFRELTQANTRLAAEIKNRVKAEKEREKVITELKEALAEVKTLSGLLPICASCKKVRDDRGDWNQIESYISDHSQAEFSHGICPDCARKLYPDIYSEVMRGK